MMKTLLIILLVGSLAGVAYIDNDRKEIAAEYAREVDESSLLKKENRLLLSENAKLKREVEKLQPKIEGPKVVERQIPAAREENNTPSSFKPAVQPKVEEVPAPVDNTQKIAVLKGKISDLDAKIYEAKENMKNKEIDWQIESSKRGIRTSDIEKNEFRAKVNSYINGLEG